MITGYVGSRGIREGNQLYHIRREEQNNYREVTIENGEAAARNASESLECTEQPLMHFVTANNNNIYIYIVYTI